MIFKYTNKYIKVDCYVFIVSNKYKSDIASIEKNLNITFPKKIFENLTDECCEIKTIPFDKFSIILGWIGQLKNKCSIEDLNTTISKIGKLLVKESSKMKRMNICMNTTNTTNTTKNKKNSCQIEKNSCQIEKLALYV